MVQSGGPPAACTALGGLLIAAAAAAASAEASCTRPEDTATEPLDVIIVGSGAAGLQGAWYFQKETDLRTAVLEKGTDV